MGPMSALFDIGSVCCTKPSSTPVSSFIGFHDIHLLDTHLPDTHLPDCHLSRHPPSYAIHLPVTSNYLDLQLLRTLTYLQLNYQDIHLPLRGGTPPQKKKYCS